MLMKNKLSENVQAFIYGAVFSVLADSGTKLLHATIGFVALETVWLVIRISFRR
jgi:hypothetical protein